MPARRPRRRRPRAAARHGRRGPLWRGLGVAGDVSGVDAQKIASLTVNESVFSGDQATLVDKYNAEDRYVGSLVGVPYAESFKARSPLLGATPEGCVTSRFG